MTTRRLFIAKPIGFCGGVRNAMNMFDAVRATHPNAPIYVLHELIHNRQTTEAMRDNGAIFVDDVERIPPNNIVLIGAHGCPQSVIAQCNARGLEIHDATCPLVTQLQQNIAHSDAAQPVILLGDAAHPEVQGLLSRLENRTVYLIENESQARALPALPAAAFFSQTTRCISEIQRIREILQTRVQTLSDHAHACQAVSQRQLAIRQLARLCDHILVVGSAHSSNARRLADIAREEHHAAVLFAENAQEIPSDVLQTSTTLGLGTATSCPDSTIQEIIRVLEDAGFVQQSEVKP